LTDSNLKDESKLNDMRDNSQHPYTSFIDPGSFSQGKALTFLCSGKDKTEIESLFSVSCAEYASPDADVRGQVVIIGDDVEGRDRHQLLGRDIAGVYLQANYIESLLDGRYLRPIGPVGNVAFLIVWLVVLYGLFWLLPAEYALAICAVVGVVIWYVAAQLTLWRGVYFDAPVHSIGIMALVIKYIEARGHSLGELIRERLPVLKTRRAAGRHRR
jgi:hypothetical protein